MYRTMCGTKGSVKGLELIAVEVDDRALALHLLLDVFDLSRSRLDEACGAAGRGDEVTSGLCASMTGSYVERTRRMRVSQSGPSGAARRIGGAGSSCSSSLSISIGSAWTGAS